MKKIMFKNTQAVIDGRQTMTRRIIKVPNRTIEGKEVCGFEVYKNHKGVPFDVWLTGPDDESLCQLLPTYKLGEVVAVAQRYSDIADDKFFINEIAADELYVNAMKYLHGWNNKQGVKAYYMPHRIRITDIKIEKLQDISDEDCLKEGIYEDKNWKQRIVLPFSFGSGKETYSSPRAAFAALIDKVSGKGTWESNPWVLAYTFELKG